MNFRMAIFLSIVIHAIAGLCLAFALPQISSSKNFPATEELEFVEIDLNDVENFVEESDAVETFDDEAIPEFEFPEIVMPELKIPEMVFEPPKITPPEIKPVEIPKPPAVQTPPPVQEKIETEPPPPKVEKPVEENISRKLNRPAVIVNEVYPPKDSVGDFTGKIILNVKIDKNGKVASADIVQGSGRIEIDKLATEYIRKWNFRPAMDERGMPMESSKIIFLDFGKNN